MAAGSAFCSRCGHPLEGAPGARLSRRRPGIITLLAILQFIGGGFTLLFGAVVFSAFATVPENSRASDLTVAAVAGLCIVSAGAVQIACGVGLWKLKRYGRSLLRFIAILGLIGFPVGTIISIAILIYLNTPGVRLLFSDKPVAELTPVEYGQLIATMQSSAALMTVVIICVVAGGAVFVGIIAAIAIPALLRARMSGNESVAIGTLRTFISAESSYAQKNGEYYGTPECLASPATCLPNYTGSGFLNGSGNAVFEKSGYLFQFTAGPVVPPGVASAKGVAPGSLERFALLAVPVRAGATGQRMFCVDATNTIRWANGSPPSVHKAVCPAEWSTF